MMITTYSKKTMRCPKIWRLTLLAFMSAGNLFAMELSPSQADKNLSEARAYLASIKSSGEAIEKAFKDYDTPFREIHSFMKDLMSVTTLIPKCSLLVEGKNLKVTIGSEIFTIGSKYKKDCEGILGIINNLNQYIQKQNYANSDIQVNISLLTNNTDKNLEPLVLCAQKIHKRAQSIRLLKTYRHQLFNDDQIKKLTKKIPIGLIAKEKSLLLFITIKEQIGNFFAYINEVCRGSKTLSLQSPFFTQLQSSLSEWINTFNNNDNSNAFKACAQKICSNNWLIDRTYAERINIKEKQENQRYDPLLHLNQCDYNAFKNALYINSPLMIDSFMLLYGSKQVKQNNKGLRETSYTLKGTIHKLRWANKADMNRINEGTLPYTKDKKGNFWVRTIDWNNCWNHHQANNYCDTVFFECAIDMVNTELSIYHRGYSSKEGNLVSQCNEDCWFLSDDEYNLAGELPSLSAQKLSSPSDHPNAYSTYTDKDDYYTDKYGNYIIFLDASCISIFMPPHGKRDWATEIVLELPNI